MNNLLLNTDSYKASHWLQYPPGTEYVSSYIESRGGKWDESVFFGLQAFLIEYLSTPITAIDVSIAAEFWAEHGEPFNLGGWEYIVTELKGILPISIEAVPEGTVIGTKNVLLQITNTDPKCYWLPSFLETALLRAIWYPTTVATNSYQAKKHIKAAFDATSDTPWKEAIGFKMHDFGARGVSSLESSGIGGAAHLVNFQGTDNVTGVLWADKYYQGGMSGFSIPASEHSTMTSWGNEPGEIDAMRNMVEQFDGEGKVFACVSDSYDILKACNDKWGGTLHEAVMGMKGTLVVRPDSGDPVQTPVDVICALMDAFGYTTNSKGYKVLPDQVRVLQGDGITENTINQIIQYMTVMELSIDNIAFGQGGGLLQQLDRDTQQFAMKCSSITVNGEQRDVFKNPVGMSMKASKKGVLALTQRESGSYHTTQRSARTMSLECLQEVWRDGELLVHTTFDEVRHRANHLLVDEVELEVAA